MNPQAKPKPVIFSVVDLTHLNPQERCDIVGQDNLEDRRKFLQTLVKAGIMVGLPGVLLTSCEPEIIYKPTEEEDEGCPNYNPCSQNPSCACQADALAIYPPKVVRTIPEKDSSFSLDPNGVEIRIDVDKLLDVTSVSGKLTISPQPAGGFDIHFYDLSNSNQQHKCALALCKPGTSNKLNLLADTNYTITLKGTIKDTYGLSLDGNKDGTGGDDFSFKFSTKKRYDACICQSDCSCVGFSCSCQSYTCTCVGFYCGCQFDACTLYRI